MNIMQKKNTNKIGLLVPSSNTIMEADFYRGLPSGATLHTARMYLSDTTVEGESAMLNDHFPIALRDLVTAKPNVIVFGCTSAGALQGNKNDALMCKRIEQEGSCKCISVIQSVSKAVLYHNIKKLAVITPYVEELNNRIKFSLEDEGINVVKIWGLGIDDNYSIADVDPERIYDFACQSVKQVAADGLVISCTNFRAMEARNDIEKTLQIPIITSNQAALEATIAALT